MFEEMRETMKATVEKAFSRYSEYVTRIELKFSDVNANKKGENDKKCVLEARPKGLQPVVVTSFGDTIDNAMSEAIDKMKASLDTSLGRLRNH